MKVLLVDDHPLILDALDAALRAINPDIQTRQASTVAEAIALLEGEGDFSIALVDLNLGDPKDGFQVLSALQTRWPEVGTTVLSGTDRLSDVVRVLDMGALGFVPKRISRAKLDEALRTVTAGGVYIPQELLDLIARWQGRGDLETTSIHTANQQLALADAAAAAQAAAAAAADGSADAVADGDVGADMGAGQGGAPTGMLPADVLASLGLTPRQTDVLALLRKGLPNKLIARELNLSVETIKDHVAAVLRALNVSSRTQAVLAVSRLIEQKSGRPWPMT